MSLRLLSLVLIANAVMTAPAEAQRVADLRPVGVVRYRPSEAPRLSIPSVAEGAKRHHVWPWFVLGGAVVGAGTVAIRAARNCDLNCQDDGGIGYAIYYGAAAAGVGAVAGGLLGAIVDLSRSDTAVGPSSRE